MKELIFKPEKKSVGYIKLWDNFFVAVTTKPSQEHLENMQNTFGWEWVDDINQPTTCAQS
jgi:hypothetical protein